MKKFFILIAAVALCSNVELKAQKQQVTKPSPNASSIKFEKDVFDFGNVNEEKGKITKIFKFKNIGKTDVQIMSVKPSCGCTTTDYTKEPVKPGKMGFVNATFDPVKRNGAFNYSIAISTNEPTNNMVNVAFKGNVIPKPKTKLETYTQAQGSLRFISHQLYFNLTNTQVKIDTVKIYNTSKKTMDITFDKLPAYINYAKAIPEKLKPEQEGKIIFQYDASKRGDIGYVYDRFTFKTNDTAQVEKAITVSANISEDFSKLTPEQLENAPKVSFDSEVFDFGKIVIGKTVDHNYVVTNTGKSKLIIRKVKASCGCTASNAEKTELLPGESTNIKAAFNSSGRAGDQSKSITVITNDPKRSNVTLTIKGFVEKEAEVKTETKAEGSINIIEAK